MARLLERHDIPLVHGKHVGDVRLVLLYNMLSIGYAVEAVGLERRIGGGSFDVAPVTLKRATADVKRGNVELLAH